MTISVPQIMTSNSKTVSEYGTAKYLEGAVVVDYKSRLSQTARSVASIGEKIGVAVMV